MWQRNETYALMLPHERYVDQKGGKKNKTGNDLVGVFILHSEITVGLTSTGQPAEVLL